LISLLQHLSHPISVLLLTGIVIMGALVMVLFKKLLSKEQGTKPDFIGRASAGSKPVDAEIIQRFKDKADQAMDLTNTYRKFVPKQFVNHFAKYGPQSLELGYADEADLAILFCDIRGFTGLSERMSPQEVMNFLNSYFMRMNDPIHQNGGFIDKFIGDAIMALFDHPNGSSKEKAVDAIRSALDLRYALNVYNQHRSNSKYPPINIGIGIHFGPVVIGTVGSDDRMDTTVIGDSVNMACRLEALAPLYNTDIVVSAHILDVADAAKYFCFRILDWVRVKGRKAPIEIYELIDHQAKSVQQLKLANALLIQQGLTYRIKQQWPQAIAHFEQALRINPVDSLVIHHLEQCEILQKQPLPKNWDGALVL
jgi:adenylate cyclase